jgi:hypothetical protein
MCAKAPGLMELLVTSVLVEVDADKNMIAELPATPLARQGSSSFASGGWRGGGGGGGFQRRRIYLTKFVQQN